MPSKLQKLKALRHFLLQQISGLTTAQLNEIPSGYHTNIIWNLAHLGAAVQALCYVRAGQPITISDNYFTPYLPGTRPTGTLDETTIKAVIDVSLTSLDQLQLDLVANKFAGYTPSAMLQQYYGVEVSDIDGALEFLLYHEGFHTGYILAIKKLVSH